MLPYLRRFISNPLITGSTIVVGGSFISNLLNYFFNLSMGRFLRVEEYGLLTALVSVWILFAVIQVTVSGVLAKFTAKYSAKKDNSALSSLILHSFKYVFVFGLVLATLLFLGIKPFSSFLHVDDIRITILLVLMIFVSIIQSVPVGILQGKLKFFAISVINFANPFLKIVLGLSAIFLGFGVFGVVFGIFISALLPLLVVILFVFRSYVKSSKKEIDIRPIFNDLKDYSFKFFLATLGITIISHGDIVLVRYFMSETVSGQYAALSLMGKAIFYVTGPISFVLYPLVAQKKEKKESVRETVLLASLIVVISSTLLSFIYFMFPHVVLSVFFPNPDYALLSKYLGPYSLFIILFALVNLLNNYFFSSGITGIYKVNIVSAAIFLGLFTMFHNSLYQVIGVLFASTLIMLLMFVYYYRFYAKK